MISCLDCQTKPKIEHDKEFQQYTFIYEYNVYTSISSCLIFEYIPFTLFSKIQVSEKAK